MGNYLLCRRAPAETPFYIESIHLNIYSLEELCYFLSTNTALADEVIMDPTLSDWLRDECGMKNIREYNSINISNGKIGYRLNWLFVKSHYFSENELRKYRMRIEAFDAASNMEKQKLKGDALIKFGKYKRSIDCYEKVFNMQGSSEMPSFFRASVYHNMGCAYVKLFQAARAAECFEKAFQTDGSEVFRDSYIRAIYFEGGFDKMYEEIKRLELDDNYLQDMRNIISEIKPKSVPKDPEKALNEWIRQYHLSVDQ